MKLVVALLLLSALVALPLAAGEGSLLEAVRLLEKLSGEGVDVSPQIRELNKVLELRREGRATEAEELLAQVVQQLRDLDRQLPAHRLHRWLRTGTLVAALLAVPPLFYYFFPRLYALVWAYSRGSWVVRRVEKRGPRR